MKPRCNGNRPGVYLSGFECCLDAGHDGRCQPYQPPTVDEWRAMVGNERSAYLRGYVAGVKLGTDMANEGAPDLDAQVIAAVRREREG